MGLQHHLRDLRILSMLSCAVSRANRCIGSLSSVLYPEFDNTVSCWKAEVTARKEKNFTIGQKFKYSRSYNITRKIITGFSKQLS